MKVEAARSRRFLGIFTIVFGILVLLVSLFTNVMLGIGSFVVGVAVLLAAVFADTIGVGVGAGFGGLQVAGALAGLLAVVVGLLLLRKASTD